MASRALSTPTPTSYRLGHHPRRTDHLALLNATGDAMTTFHLGATRAEIIETLASAGYALNEDDTVTLAEAQPQPGRRGVLAGVAAIAASAIGVAAGPAYAGERPDAALLAALAEFNALELRIWPPGYRAHTIEQEEEDERANAPLVARQDDLLTIICTLRATTLEGCQARARSLLLWDKELPKALAAGDDADGYDDDRMLQALIRDLATIGERAA